MLLKLNNSHIRTLIRCFQTRTRSEKLLLFSTVGAGGWNNLNFNSLADKVPYLNNNIFQQKRWVMHVSRFFEESKNFSNYPSKMDGF